MLLEVNGMTNRETLIQNCKDTNSFEDDAMQHLYEVANEELSIEELRKKYNYPEMGLSLPDWLTYDELLKISFSVAKLMYRPFFAGELSQRELAHLLYIKASIKLYTIRSHAQLKHAMIMMSANIYRDLSRKYKHRAEFNIEDMTSYYDDNLDSQAYWFVYKYAATTDEDLHFINVIRSIKSDKIRMILIITGYAVAEIDELFDDFCALFNTDDVKLLAQLDSILDALEYNEELRQSRVVTENKDTTHKRYKKQITFNFILKAFGLSRQKDCILNMIANELY